MLNSTNSPLHHALKIDSGTVGSNGQVEIPSEMRPEQDWAFFNDPSHPHFALLESTIASRAYRSQVIIDFYRSTIPNIEALIKQISEALKKG